MTVVLSRYVVTILVSCCVIILVGIIIIVACKSHFLNALRFRGYEFMDRINCRQNVGAYNTCQEIYISSILKLNLSPTILLYIYGFSCKKSSANSYILWVWCPYLKALRLRIYGQKCAICVTSLCYLWGLSGWRHTLGNGHIFSYPIK